MGAGRGVTVAFQVGWVSSFKHKHTPRNRSRVEIEVVFEPPAARTSPTGASSPPPPLLLDATLAGCSSGKVSPHSCQDCAYLGLMIGHNRSTGGPLVTTFRQWNAETYWRPLDALDLPPLKHPPKLFPLMDSFTGDDDVGLWETGIAALAKLGFRGTAPYSIYATFVCRVCIGYVNIYV